MQLWLFVTLIIYPTSIVLERFRLLVALNPLNGILESFRNSLAQGINILTGQLRRRAAVSGVPEGLTFKTLNELCLRHLGEPLKRASYVPFIHWRSSRTGKLFLQTVRGRFWRLIYKNAVRLDHMHALIGYSTNPSSPEYLVYGSVHEALATYLPAVYLCREVIPGEHYQYLLEDLHREYRHPHKPEVILKTVAELPAIHRAIKEWSFGVDQY